jgi:hypothetical protein
VRDGDATWIKIPVMRPVPIDEPPVVSLRVLYMANVAVLCENGRVVRTLKNRHGLEAEVNVPAAIHTDRVALLDEVALREPKPWNRFS